MVEQFDVINDFFNRDEFTENELIELKNLVKEKYDDKKKYGLAKALIDLELIRFELKNKDDNNSISARLKNIMSPKNKKIDTIKNIQKSDVKKKVQIELKNVVHPKFQKNELRIRIPNREQKKEDTTLMSIEDMLVYLKGRNLMHIINEISDTDIKEGFLNLLRLKGYYKGRLNIILTEEEFLSIEEELKTAILTNRVEKPKVSIKTGKKLKNNRSISKSSNVYDKIKNFKGAIKLIYIRSK